MSRKYFATNQHEDSFDDSFATLEKMCDKTASDPDSTLYKYLYGDTKESDVQDNVNNSDECNLVPDLENIRIEQENEFKNISCGDVTQLDDIEPPTRLWENTFLDNIEPEISPVKMVGLMRPSTIIEENNESEVSRTSYHTAKKDLSDDNTTSSYTTAYDYCNPYKYSLPEKAKRAFAGVDRLGNKLINPESLNSSASNKKTDAIKFPIDAADNNMTTIELECDDSIIDLVSDEDDTYDQEEIDKIIKSAIALEAIKRESESSDNSKSDIDDSKQSLNFDDTMEEVDYLINQYIAQTNAKIASNVIKSKEAEEIEASPSNNLLHNVKTPEKAFESSSASTKRLYERGVKIKQYVAHFNAKVANDGDELEEVQETQVFKTLNVFHKPKTPKKTFEDATVLNKRVYEKGENKENRYALNLNMPKLDLFKNTKSPVKKVNNEYKHVVSPIGTYIHKTTTAPLMTNFKSVSTTTNINDASVFKNLDVISNKVGTMQTYDEKDLMPNGPTKLPKKAYISSDCKQFFDERQAVKIPGGQKMQKFLDSATSPAVVRHEGKTRIPTGMFVAVESKNEVLQQNDSTLDGLDVQAGEMSVYTIKDAQKFK